MNLLDATSVLIDCAKTHGHENDRVLQAALRRMEKRLRLLKRRQLRALRRLRWESWYDACIMLGQFKKRDDGTIKEMGLPECNYCGFTFDFKTFVRHATLRQRGHVVKLDCPDCGKRLLGLLGLEFESEESFATLCNS